MNILENYPLKPLTSMYIGGNARYFCEVSSIEELKEALFFAKQNSLKVFILGGGSNIIISDKGFDGLVIKMCIKFKSKVSEDENNVVYEVGAGESWDGFVEFAVNSGLYGIENLSHIPGTVGASVVQNIGAYGQEVSSNIVSVRVIDRDSLVEKVLSKSDLNFSYRKSELNNLGKYKDKFVVVSVTFSLGKKGKLSSSYDDIRKYFLDNPNEEQNLKNIRKAVISIRDKKFPFPNKPENGTVGSFWNADTIDEPTYDKIIEKLENMGFSNKAQDMRNKKSVFTVTQGFKVPYGVLVEVLGFKGREFGNAKILGTHSCVINNFTGKASAKEIVDISNEVIGSVKKEFGILMKTEPELVGDFI